MFLSFVFDDQHWVLTNRLFLTRGRAVPNFELCGFFKSEGKRGIDPRFLKFTSAKVHIFIELMEMMGIHREKFSLRFWDASLT